MRYLLILLFFFSLTVQGQDNSALESRALWSLSYHFGIPDGSTNDFVGSLNRISVGRGFPVTKFLSLNGAFDYSHIGREQVGADNNFGLGGGIALYPLYFGALITGRDYVPENDRLHVNFDFNFLLNKSDFNFNYKVEANLYTFSIGSGWKFSPRIAYMIFMDDKETSDNPLLADLKYNSLGFYSVGVNIGFPKKGM